MNQTSLLAFSNMQNWRLFDSQIPVRPRIEGSLILQLKKGKIHSTTSLAALLVFLQSRNVS
jgi:hypothetical protein